MDNELRKVWARLPNNSLDVELQTMIGERTAYGAHKEGVRSGVGRLRKTMPDVVFSRHQKSTKN